MIIEDHNNILKIKTDNINFVKLFDLDLFNMKYNNYDVILVIDFLIDSILIDILKNWITILERTDNSLIVVVGLIDEYLIKNQSIVFVPTLNEAIDYIELEKINKDLGL